MDLNIKFILIIFLNFFTFNLFSLNIPENIIIKVIKEIKDQTEIQSKNT